VTDEEWKKFSSNFQKPGDDSYPAPIEGALNLGKGVVKGLGKGAASMVPESIEGKTIKDWSSSPGDPNSAAERWGETGGDVAANVAPFLLTPELGVASKLGTLAAKVGPRIGTWGARAGRMIENTALGAFGGGSDAALHNEEAKTPEEFGRKVKRGAVEGGTTSAAFAAGRLAYEALSPALKHLIKMGAVAGGGLAVFDEMGGRHYIPHWMIYGLGAPLAEQAAKVTKLPPAVVGAGAARLGDSVQKSDDQWSPSKADQ
jgi:hypothetical protein